VPVLVFAREYPLSTGISRNRPLAEEECVRIFSQIGSFPFSVESVSCRIAENLFCPVGELKETRRQFFHDLQEFYLDQRAEERRARKAALAERLEIIHRRRITGAPARTFILSGSPHPSDCGEYDFTAYPILLTGDPEAPPSVRTVLLLPHFVPEAAVGDWKARLRQLVGQGYTRFIAPTYGWFYLRKEIPAAEFIAGPYCYAVNPLAVDFLERNGVRAFILSPDIPGEDAGAVSRFSGRLVALNAPKEMFITRLRVPPGEYVFKGKVFRPRYFPEYTVVEER
jgi:hypothetical protein